MLSTKNLYNPTVIQNTNKKNIMKCLFLLPFFLLTGCSIDDMKDLSSFHLPGSITVDDMKGLSSYHVGCSPNEITIEDPGSTSIANNWTAICKGKTLICSESLSTYDRKVSCTERVE